MSSLIEQSITSKIDDNVDSLYRGFVVTEANEHRNDSTIPIVFMFGWAGCRDRYLSKYSAIYEQNQYLKFA